MTNAQSNWYKLKLILFCILCFSSINFSQAQQKNEAIEPILKGEGVIQLIKGDALNDWLVPSSFWSIRDGVIIGDTRGEKLNASQWLYTKQSFGDFEFTIELKLSGDHRRNTGIYYRVHPFLFTNAKGTKSYQAPSGYEFDASFHIEGNRNDRGALADWYARRSLRILPDQTIINQVYKPDEWNRMTIRARGNRLEYWINGIKIMDYLDQDTKASKVGVIGFQLHNGSVMKVEYKNSYVRPLKP
jgi:hypothetical protein